MEKTNRAPSAQHQMMVVVSNLAPVSSPTTPSIYIFRKGMDEGKYTLAKTATTITKQKYNNHQKEKKHHISLFITKEN